MGFTALERLLEVVRARPKAAVNGSFGVPLIHEHALPGHPDPFLVTGATGKFLKTRRVDGMVRCGMFPCPTADEDALVGRMAEALTAAEVFRCTSLQDTPAGFVPKSLLVSSSLVGSAGVDLEKASEIMGLTGNLGSLKGLQVVLTAADVPPILFGPQAGVYVRSGNHLGLILSPQQIVQVEHAVARSAG
jgi:hypothetical protein